MADHRRGKIVRKRNEENRAVKDTKRIKVYRRKTANMRFVSVAVKG